MSDSSIEHEMGPFAVIPLWVMDRLIEARKPEVIRLYVQLHRWTGRNRSCYPSRQTIADACGVSTDTVDRDVKVLVSIGALRVEHRRSPGGDRTSNEYTLVDVEPGRKVAATGRKVAATVRADAATSPHGCGDGSRTDAATVAAQLRQEPDKPEPHKPEPDTRAPILSLASQAKEPPRASSSSSPKRRRATEVCDPAFEAFWEAYPRKVGKPAAQKAWKRVNGHASAVMPGLVRWRTAWDERGEPQFIPHPSTWLNQERWNDEPPPPPRPKQSAAMKAIRRFLSDDQPDPLIGLRP